MFRLGSQLLCPVVALMVTGSLGFAQSSSENSPLLTRPHNRINLLIDDEQRVVLRGNLHPLANSQTRLGMATQQYRMEHMILQLKPDAAQQKSLDDLVVAQHDPQSPYYHQWLTPESYGQMFGVSDNDLLQVMNWLQQHGMTVEEIPAGRRAVIFSGTAGQVMEAFHTQIQTFRVGEELHHANGSEPEIPAALAGVVGGVVALHDFRSEPMHAAATTPSPSFTTGSAHYLAPSDFATIYDLTPLYQQSINGSGQSIAIVGRTNIHLSDVHLFRSNFGLPVNDPQIIVNGSDPGIVNTNEEVEADLDVEWSGAVARNAAIKFVVSASSSSSDGVYLSSQYIVNHNVAPVMSVSFGLCEAALGAAGNSFLNNLWQQAAAEGITVFVSSGDSGAAGCASSSATTASGGLAINGLCSTPYSVCVGGNQFADGDNPALYWSTANTAGTQASALSYIPEKVWNESGSSGLWSTGGGVSVIYGKPAWQVGTGVPADAKRDVPDVALTAAGHDGYLIYLNGGLNVVGGTSAASPAFAGLMSLVVQNSAARQGIANSVFYTLATKQRSGGAAVFHDIVSGNNSVPGLTGYSAGAGYDRATGLGSVDANVMVTHWADALAVPTFQFSSSSGSLSVVAGGSSTVNVAAAGSGGFNGAVALAITGLPAGVTQSFTPASIGAPGAGTSVLRLIAAGNAPVGSTAANIVATSGGITRTVPLTLTVTLAPTYTLSAAQSSISVSPGQQGTVRLTTSPNSAFKSAVALGVTGVPAGVSASFSPASIAAPGAGSSTLTLAASVSAVSGSYTLTGSGTSGDITQRVPLTLNIPGFTLVSSATATTVAPKGRVTLTFTTTGVGGFNSPIAFSVSGLPAGVSGTFTPQTTAAGAKSSSVLTLTRTSTGASTGKITVTAVGGGLTRTQLVTLNLTATAQTLTIKPLSH